MGSSGINNNTLGISWGKFGVYELTVSGDELAGSYVGKPQEWRKMRKLRDLSPVELRMLGAEGQGSEWTFIYDGGSFPITFKGDGYNHFVCKQYPAHAHWTLGGAEGDELTIFWDKFGTYTMKVDAAGTGAGCLKDHPAQWRKMEFVSFRERSPADMECTLHD